MSELCADAMWLPSEKKKLLKEMFELPEPKETRELVEFNPCPDCRCEKYPLFDRRKTYNGMSLESSIVSAFCEVCGWETQFHNNVKECAKEWNEAEV